MKKSVKEWLDKAEEDYIVAMREYRARTRPVYSAVCFHAQQCVEKHLKAILEEHRVEVYKTHSLPALLAPCLEWCPLLESLREDLVRLSAYAVELRYPGESADNEDARNAVAMMRRCRTELRSVLGLPIERKSRKRRQTKRK